MRILSKQEETLLFNDICARLPHGVKIAEVDIMTDEAEGAYEVITVNKDRKTIGYDTPDCVIHCYRNMEMVKPYLHSMSDMTEKEIEIYHKKNQTDRLGGMGVPIRHHLYRTQECIDWLIKNHFDFRGLIGKRLAIKVTPDNNPYKKKTKMTK